MNLKFRVLFVVIIIFHCCYSSKDGHLINIEALTGETIYFPCNVTTHEGDEVVLVLWYRDDKGTPIYSVDVRRGISNTAKRWSDPTVFGERAYFIFDKEPGMLSIQNTQNTDTGSYRCRVDFLKAQTRNVRIKLIVVDPPEQVIIRDDLNVERSTVVGPYSEGDIMSLKCEALGGKPLPTISWYRDGIEVVAETSVVPGEKFVQAEITLGPLGREDLNSRLTCRASNHPRATPLEAVVQIDMNFPPLNIRLLGAHQPLSAGRRYDLLCQSAGSRPPAVITWWQNGIRLEKTTETTSSDGNQTTSTLSIIFSKSDAGKYLSCKAYNNAVPSDPLEDGWKLDIQYIPETYVRLGTSLDPNAIREGTDVYFDCLVVAHPGVFRVEWRHNGRTLPHNISQGVIVSNQSLVLQGVTRATAGNYSCVGFNAEGEGVSDPFPLNILYTPTCIPNQQRVYGVAKQEDAKISCLVDANPPEVEFSWTFNNSAESIDVAANHIARSGTSSTVTYTPITELDYGTLLCIASNKIGRQKIPCVFHIIAAGRPDQVHNCSLSNISMTALTVTCADGFNGGLPQKFILELKDVYTKELKVNITSTIPRFTVSTLSPGVLYDLSIYAFNAKGRSDVTMLSAAMLRMPEKQLTSEHADKARAEFLFSPVVSLTVGLTLAVMVAGLAIILALRIPCNRARRRQKDFSNDHSSREGSPGLSDKSSGSKEADGNESDDKNPDVVPEVIDSEEQIDCMRRRQHVSTIEAGCSPSRGVLANASAPPPQYAASGMTLHSSHNIGYCTLRNTLQTPSSAASFSMNVTPHIYSNSISQCTLPRHVTQMWPTYSGTIAGVRPIQQVNTLHQLSLQNHPAIQLSQHSDVPASAVNPIVPSIGRTIALQAITQENRNRICGVTVPNPENLPVDQNCVSDDEDTVQTPLMIKRESSV